MSRHFEYNVPWCALLSNRRQPQRKLSHLISPESRELAYKNRGWCLTCRKEFYKAELVINTTMNKIWRCTVWALIASGMAHMRRQNTTKKTVHSSSLTVPTLDVSTSFQEKDQSHLTTSPKQKLLCKNCTWMVTGDDLSSNSNSTPLVGYTLKIVSKIRIFCMGRKKSILKKESVRVVKANSVLHALLAI